LNVQSTVIGINRGKKTAFKLRDNRPIRVYHVTGRFGSSTETHFNDSAVTVRATFDHVHHVKIASLLASMQASHQKKMFELSGVSVQSQTAYELAVQGPLRPTVTNVPLLYSLKCIDFRRPYFTIGKR
jgi:mitochondrial mRNA pseudouridine synthase TRUB2